MDRDFEQVLAHITLEHYRRLSRVIQEDRQYRHGLDLADGNGAMFASPAEHSSPSRRPVQSKTQPAWTTTEPLAFQPVDSNGSTTYELPKEESQLQTLDAAESAGASNRGTDSTLFSLVPQAAELPTPVGSESSQPPAPEQVCPLEELPLPNTPCEDLAVQKIFSSPAFSSQKSLLSRRGTGTISLPGLDEPVGASCSETPAAHRMDLGMALKLKAKGSHLRAGRSHKRSNTNYQKEALRPHSLWAEACQSPNEITALFQSSKTINTLALDNFRHNRSRTNLFGLRQAAAQGEGIFSPRLKLALTLTPKTFVSDPSSKHKLLWDFFGMALLAYDIVFIPLQIFELPVNQFTMTMQWLTLAYWLADVPMSFLVGFHRGGALEMRVHEIAKRYLRTWFCMDVLLLVLDAVLLAEQYHSSGVSENPIGIARVGKTFRVMRILRAVRLLRLFKLPATWSYLQESIQSESTFLIMGVIKMAISILVINHFVACMWYGISTWIDHGSTWRHHPSIESLEQTASIPYLYTTSLHWSLTQFTPASMEVHPRNVAERIFAVVVIVFAMIVFSSFVSSITSAMNTLNNMSSENAKNFMVLQRYFRNHQISLKLCVKVRRHLDVVLEKGKQKIYETDVKLLPMLSENLRVELHFEIFGPALHVHKFFARFETEHPRTLHKICHTAVCSVVLTKGDVLFSLGEKATNMYFLRNGSVRYTMKDDLFKSSEGKEGKDGRSSTMQNWTLLQEGDWLSEAILWTPWVHHGHAIAHDEETSVAVEPTRFHEVVRLHSSALDGPARYAIIFVNHLQRQDVLWSDLAEGGFDMDRALDVAFHDADVSDDEESQSEEAPEPARRQSLNGSQQEVPSATS